MEDFENEELKKAKQNRTIGEYCWTCSSCLIKYVLETYNPDYCTYIDADTYFYSDPYIIIKEMQNKNASVQIVGHRFNKCVEQRETFIKGRFCVEFNTFKNDDQGKLLLDIWTQQCLNYCKADFDGIHYGDQKYLDNWLEDYPFVIESQNLGLGVAPWNIAQYKHISQDNESIIFHKKSKQNIQIIFYHFEFITYLNYNTANIGGVYNAWNTDKKLVNSLYIPYLKKVNAIKNELKRKYGLDILIKSHPAYNLKKKKISSIIKKIVQHPTQSFHNFVYITLPDIIYSQNKIIKF